MRRVIFFLAAQFFSLAGHAALPPASGKPLLQAHRVDHSSVILVILAADEAGPATRIWLPGNSWGAANWRIYVVRGSELFPFRQDPDQLFSRNAPLSERLRGSREISLDIKSNVWIGPKSKMGSFMAGDKVIVAYEVPVTPEARHQGVWYGTLSTMLNVD